MDHSLRSISYIADIGDLVVLMARRVPSQQEQQAETGENGGWVLSFFLFSSDHFLLASEFVMQDGANKEFAGKKFLF